MLTFKQFLNESSNPYDDAVEWLATLDLNKRAPKGMKKEMDWLKFAKQQADSAAKYPGGPPEMLQTNVMRVINDLKPIVDKINAKLGKKDSEPLVVDGKYAIYHKEDKAAYKKFQDSIKNLEAFFATLKGYHKKAMAGPKTKVVFTSSIKSTAKYSRDRDALLVNARKAGNTLEKYGSLRYIVLHELGHRYLTQNRQPWDIDNWRWVTTKYSEVDSWSGEEKFAELFAITNWPSQYAQHKQKMDEFKKVIK